MDAMIEIEQSVIDRAAQRLREGGLVAFPTETVYGLGADALNGEAVARVFAAKGRPHFNPLIVHVPDVGDAQSLCHMPREAQILAKAFWPGPLTLVLERKPDCPISPLVSAGLSTLAVRVPAHRVARALLAASRLPVAAPSANRSGHVSATHSDHVRADIVDLGDGLIEGGATEIGIESTVIAVGGTTRGGANEPVVLLRAGAIETRAIEQVLGRRLSKQTDVAANVASSPGQLASHYAPTAVLRLNATSVDSDEALLAFGHDVPRHVGPFFNLSEAGDLLEAAANLFSALRELDRSGARAIAVMHIPNDGLGEAINDRLVRAAAPRPEA